MKTKATLLYPCIFAAMLCAACASNPGTGKRDVLENWREESRNAPDYYHGFGAGTTEMEAMQDALADTAMQLGVKVRSVNLFTAEGTHKKESAAFKMEIESSVEQHLEQVVRFRSQRKGKKNYVWVRLGVESWNAQKQVNIARMEAYCGSRLSPVLAGEEPGFSNRIAIYDYLASEIKGSYLERDLYKDRGKNLLYLPWLEQEIMFLLKKVSIVLAPSEGLISPAVPVVITALAGDESPIEPLHLLVAVSGHNTGALTVKIRTDNTGVYKGSLEILAHLPEGEVRVSAGLDIEHYLKESGYLVSKITRPEVSGAFVLLKDMNSLLPAEVLVPAGTFIFGAEQDNLAEPDESPAAEIYLEDFYIDKYEVTNALYALFLSENPDVDKPAFWNIPGFREADKPVTGVTWHEANRYAAWAGKRLPAAREWEKAAKGGRSVRYPWGNVQPESGEYAVCGTWGNPKYPASVGSKPSGKNSLGIFDMAGNVWEWTADRNGSAEVRGGSWTDDVSALRTTNRWFLDPAAGYYNVGFRCVRDAEPLKGGKE